MFAPHVATQQAINMRMMLTCVFIVERNRTSVKDVAEDFLTDQTLVHIRRDVSNL